MEKKKKKTENAAMPDQLSNMADIGRRQVIATTVARNVSAGSFPFPSAYCFVLCDLLNTGSPLDNFIFFQEMCRRSPFHGP